MSADEPSQPPRAPRVAVVGPCGSGKSTIIKGLRSRGIDARMPAQEHSGVPEMWRKLVNPDLLVLLDAPNEVLRARRPGIWLTDPLLAKQRLRLANARANAALRFDSSAATAEEIVGAIVAALGA